MHLSDTSSITQHLKKDIEQQKNEKFLLKTKQYQNI